MCQEDSGNHHPALWVLCDGQDPMNLVAMATKVTCINDNVVIDGLTVAVTGKLWYGIIMVKVSVYIYSSM